MEASVFFPQWEEYSLSNQTGENVATITYSCRAVGELVWPTLAMLAGFLQSPGAQVLCLHKANTYHVVTKPETQLLEEK